MKKILFVLFGTMIMLGLSLTGCDQNPSGEKATTGTETKTAEEQRAIVEEAIVQVEEVSASAQDAIYHLLATEIPAARGLVRSEGFSATVTRNGGEVEEELSIEEEDAIWESLTEEEKQSIKDVFEIYEAEYSAIEIPTIFYKGVPNGVIETETEIIIQGDMVLSKMSADDLQYAYELASKHYGEESFVDTRGLYINSVKLWKRGKVNRVRYDAVVKYTFEGFDSGSGERKITGDNKKLVYSVIANIEKNTDVKFLEDTRWSWFDERFYRWGWRRVVKVFIDPTLAKGVNGMAHYGRAKQGYCKFAPHIFSKDDNGNYYQSYVGTIYHELGHTLGLAHEFDRTDAGKYITWYSSSWKEKCETTISMSSFTPVGHFDYGSVMNYNGAYKRNDTGKRLTRNPYFTTGDYKTINTMY